MTLLDATEEGESKAEFDQASEEGGSYEHANSVLGLGGGVGEVAGILSNARGCPINTAWLVGYQARDSPLSISCQR